MDIFNRKAVLLVSCTLGASDASISVTATNGVEDKRKKSAQDGDGNRKKRGNMPC